MADIEPILIVICGKPEIQEKEIWNNEKRQYESRKIYLFPSQVKHDTRSGRFVFGEKNDGEVYFLAEDVKDLGNGRYEMDGYAESTIFSSVNDKNRDACGFASGQASGTYNPRSRGIVWLHNDHSHASQ